MAKQKRVERAEKVPGENTDIKRQVMKKQKRQAMHKTWSFYSFVFLENKVVFNSTLANNLLIHSLSKHIYFISICARQCSIYWDYIIEQKKHSVLSWSLHVTGGDGHKDK